MFFSSRWEDSIWRTWRGGERMGTYSFTSARLPGRTCCFVLAYIYTYIYSLSNKLCAYSKSVVKRKPTIPINSYSILYKSAAWLLGFLAFTPTHMERTNENFYSIVRPSVRPFVRRNRSFGPRDKREGKQRGGGAELGRKRPLPTFNEFRPSKFESRI
ncbi:hypothetical protein F4811DRAFT_358409 [Daldinia bambusicola]|nr:hypothetical protein F4811DRAFT_358409 [Daldinia bambusicola]